MLSILMELEDKIMYLGHGNCSDVIGQSALVPYPLAKLKIMICQMNGLKCHVNLLFLG